MGEIFTAAGQIIATDMQVDAMKSASDKQLKALREQRDFVYNSLNPEVLGSQAAQQDIRQTLARRALQETLDPALAEQRKTSEDLISKILPELGRKAEIVSDQAALEALTGLPRIEEAKQKLIDAAIAELDAGATLPDDVQAELVKAGLEQSGLATGSASGVGLGGQLARRILGTAAVQLQQQRQQQAANLTAAAQNLETQRQNILQSLFPRLAQVQLGNLGATQSVMQQSNSMLPQAGLSGTDIANIWLARVGAVNQLGQSAADAQARAGMGIATALGTGIGAATGAIGGALPTLRQSWPMIKSWFSSPGTAVAGGSADLAAAGAANFGGGLAI